MLSAPEAKTLNVRADLTEINRVRSFLREYLSGLVITEEDVLRIELSLHEIFVNIVTHAYLQESGEIKIRIWKNDRILYLEIRDRGVPFNPSEWKALDIDEKIRQGTSGGWGIFFFRTLMDGHSYRRDSGENILTIYKMI